MEKLSTIFIFHICLMFMLCESGVRNRFKSKIKKNAEEHIWVKMLIRRYVRGNIIYAFIVCWKTLRTKSNRKVLKLTMKTPQAILYNLKYTKVTPNFCSFHRWIIIYRYGPYVIHYSITTMNGDIVSFCSFNYKYIFLYFLYMMVFFIKIKLKKHEILRNKVFEPSIFL